MHKSAPTTSAKAPRRLVGRILLVQEEERHACTRAAFGRLPRPAANRCAGNRDGDAREFVVAAARGVKAPCVASATGAGLANAGRDGAEAGAARRVALTGDAVELQRRVAPDVGGGGGGQKAGVIWPGAWEAAGGTATKSPVPGQCRSDRRTPDVRRPPCQLTWAAAGAAA